MTEKLRHGTYIPAPKGEVYNYIVVSGHAQDFTVLASETNLMMAKSTAENYLFKGQAVSIWKLIGEAVPEHY